MNFKYSTFVGALLVAAASLGTAHAAEKDGVSCPVGWSTEYTGSGETRTLFCQKRVEIASACLPRMNRTFDGIDQCIPQGVGGASPSGPFLNGAQYPNVKKWHRDIHPTGPDVFYGMDRTFPVGAVFVGDPAKGVTCPANYQPKTRNSGQVFLCEKIETTSVAKCEWTFALEQDVSGNKDRCKGTLPPFSIRATIPNAVLSTEVFRVEDAMGQVNWVLNELPGRDSWTKKVYAYPRVN